MNIVYMLMAACAGSFIALQATANASLRHRLNDPWYAAFFSICGTITTAVILMLIFRPSPPTTEAIRSAPWWNWIGGPLGVMIVLAGATLAPKLGAAAFISSVVGGQLICSLVLDHFGLMELPQQGITLGRLVGALFVVLGVGMIKYL